MNLYLATQLEDLDIIKCADVTGYNTKPKVQVDPYSFNLLLLLLLPTFSGNFHQEHSSKIFVFYNPLRNYGLDKADALERRWRRSELPHPRPPDAPPIDMR